MGNDISLQDYPDRTSKHFHHMPVCHTRAGSLTYQPTILSGHPSMVGTQNHAQGVIILRETIFDVGGLTHGFTENAWFPNRNYHVNGGLTHANAHFYSEPSILWGLHMVAPSHQGKCRARRHRYQLRASWPCRQ